MTMSEASQTTALDQASHCSSQTTSRGTGVYIPKCVLQESPKAQSYWPALNNDVHRNPARRRLSSPLPANGFIAPPPPPPPAGNRVCSGLMRPMPPAGQHGATTWPPEQHRSLEAMSAASSISELDVVAFDAYPSGVWRSTDQSSMVYEVPRQPSSSSCMTSQQLLLSPLGPTQGASAPIRRGSFDVYQGPASAVQASALPNTPSAPMQAGMLPVNSRCNQQPAPVFVSSSVPASEYMMIPAAAAAAAAPSMPQQPRMPQQQLWRGSFDVPARGPSRTDMQLQLQPRAASFDYGARPAPFAQQQQLLLLSPSNGQQQQEQLAAVSMHSLSCPLPMALSQGTASMQQFQQQQQALLPDTAVDVQELLLQQLQLQDMASAGIGGLLSEGLTSIPTGVDLQLLPGVSVNVNGPATAAAAAAVSCPIAEQQGLTLQIGAAQSKLQQLLAVQRWQQELQQELLQLLPMA